MLPFLSSKTPPAASADLAPLLTAISPAPVCRHQLAVRSLPSGADTFGLGFSPEDRILELLSDRKLLVLDTGGKSEQPRTFHWLGIGESLPAEWPHVTFLGSTYRQRGAGYVRCALFVEVF